MTNLQGSDLQALSSIRNGALCAALYSDERWYRSQVVEVNGDDVTVLFVDYGNSEVVTADVLCQLPAMFASLPLQAVPCCLAGVVPVAGDDWSEEAFDMLEQFSAYPVRATALEISAEGVHHVNICNDENVDLAETLVAEGLARRSGEEPVESTASKAPAKSATIPKHPSLVAGNVISMMITCVESPRVFRCQFADSEESLEELTAEMAAHFSSAPIEPLPAGTTLCVAQCADGSWSRAELLQSDETSCEVLFVDYGYAESVGKDCVAKLPEQFVTKLPFQAVACQLANVTEPSHGWGLDLQQTLADELTEQYCDVELLSISDDGVLVCNITLSSGNNVADLVRSHSATPSAPADDAAAAPADDAAAAPKVARELPSSVVMTVGETADVVITHVEDSGRVWVQVSMFADELAELQSELAAHYDSEEGSAELLNDADVQDGLLCVARSAEDSAWYRAKVAQRSADSAVVQFVDYGNSEEVAVAELRHIHDDFVTWQLQAVAVTVPSLDKQVSDPNALEALRGLVEQEAQLNVAAVSETGITGGLVISELQQSLGDVIAASLNSAEQPDTVEAQEEVSGAYEQQALAVDAEVEVYVSDVVSPSCLFCQPAHQAEQLAELMERLSVAASSLATPTRLNQLKACLAKFSEDNGWYRGEILSVCDGEASANVRFVDYGNQDIVALSDIRELPSEYLSLPAQAIKCALAQVQSPNEDGEWDPEVGAELGQLMNSQAGSLYVFEAAASPSDATLVSLHLEDGTDVSEVVVEKFGGVFVEDENENEIKDIADASASAAASTGEIN